VATSRTCRELPCVDVSNRYVGSAKSNSIVE
jgi:hypothetical protein